MDMGRMDLNRIDVDGLLPDDECLSALAAAIGAKLAALGWTVTVAESCTGGGVGFVLTSVAGSSCWFEEGFITYANAVKQRRLQVPNDLLENEGAVSESVVKAMASGAVAASGADCALAISGIAGPGGAVPGKPVGTVWFGWSVDGRVDAAVQHFEGDRSAVRRQAIHYGLHELLARLPV